MRQLIAVACAAFASGPAQAVEPTKPAEKEKVVLEASNLDLSKPDAEGAVLCFTLPARLSPALKKRLSPLVIEAAKAARPAYASHDVVEVPVKDPKKSRITTVPCLAIVSIDLQAQQGAREASLELIARDTATDKELARTLTPGAPASVKAVDLGPAWSTLWAAVVPPPPPPPPPKPPEPPPEPAPFVDNDLRVEQKIPEAKPKRSLLSVGLRAGLLSRSVGAGGTPIDMSGLPSLGADATLHIDGLAGFALESPHQIDLDVGYARRIAHGVLGDTNPTVDADRFSVAGTYRYRIQKTSTQIGPTVGWELLRFEIAKSAGAFSPRYGVIRAGLDARQPFNEGTIVVSLLANGAARITPGADGGSSNVGFDIGGGPELCIDRSFFARALVRYTAQTGSTGATPFEDKYLDLDLSLGFSL
ncbi:MAG: hypothetical protein U1E65_16185 [Myxococcota bacterium]